MPWSKFIKAHQGSIVGMDFFTVEVMTLFGIERVPDATDLFTEVSRGVDKWLWLVEAHLQAER
jgi:hypothetical protein